MDTSNAPVLLIIIVNYVMLEYTEADCVKENESHILQNLKV